MKGVFVHKEKKDNKKKYILIGIIILLIIILSFFIFNLKKNKQKNEKKKSEFELTIEEKQEIQKEFSKKFEKKKKTKGKTGDKKIADVLEVNLDKNIIDYKKKIFPKLTLKLKDESGIFRVRILLKYNENIIGYIQENPDSPKENMELNFDFNHKVILDELKTFKDYEGADIFYDIYIWDNNMNLKKIEYNSSIKIIDNTKPDKIKAYWTFFYNEEEKDIEIYNNKSKNKFIIYNTNDLPNLKENKIKKYYYGLKSLDGKLILKVGIDAFKESRKEIELDIEEGKYIFFVQAYDLNENMNEKNIKIYIDYTSPSLFAKIDGGIKYIPDEDIKIKLKAEDNLSGVFRYKIARKKEDLLWTTWNEYKENITYKSSYNYGVNEFWIQVEDKALNRTDAASLPYYVVRPKNISVKAVSGEKERKTDVDKRNFQIKGSSEK